ncbi:hypothetical protein M5C72_00255 [Companilactobacillus allii]|nr:hypothetical protein [Companilactobacillus allii]USQ68704.1 hypothetical protein M5C72_00255 [Companilactobacillus allii]
MKEISINDVISIQIIGSTGKLKSLDFMLPVSTAYGIFYSRMSMIKNPLGVELILKNKERIYLDASRDFTYHPKETVKELNTLISSFDPKVRKTDTLQ